MSFPQLVGGRNVVFNEAAIFVDFESGRYGGCRRTYVIRYRNLGDDLVRVAFWADGILLHWIESLSVGIALQTNSGETWSPFTNNGRLLP